MSGSFFTVTWQELLPFPISQSTIHRPEHSLGFFSSQVYGSGLHNSPGKTDVLAADRPQTLDALGGRLSPSPGPGGWSLRFPEPPAKPRHKCPLGSPAQNAARAASRVEGQGVVRRPAENRRPDLETGSKLEWESSSAAIIWVPNKEPCLRPCPSWWLQLSAQTVAASEVSDRGKHGAPSVLLRV